MMRKPRILVYDPYYGGHHSQYLEHLVKWQAAHGQCELVLALHGRLLGESSLLAATAERQIREQKVICVSSSTITQGGLLDLLRRDVKHMRLIRSMIERFEPDHCLLMYFDHVQLSLAMDLRFDHPVSFSGIYFRPTFHYSHFRDGEASIAARIHRFRKRFLLERALGNPHFNVLFSLDPYAVDHIRGWSVDADVRALPDGVETHAPVRSHVDVRRDWGVEQGRTVALMFGVIDQRKGIFQVLDAMALLAKDVQDSICLALIGPQADEERERIQNRIRKVRAQTNVQIVEDDQFISRDDIPDIVASADFVVLTYVKHVGSSNVLVHAGAAGRPVLGPNYGLVGEYIRRLGLGLPVDSTDPANVAEGVAQMVADPSKSFEPGSASNFASMHTAERFSQAIFDAILD